MTNHLFQWTEFALGHGARLLTILLIALLLIRVLRILTRRLIAAASNESATRVARMRERQTRTLAGIIYSAGTAIIVIVAALMALPEFGFNITPVAAAAGLASLSIGFGAQHVVRDFINGFFTVLEDQYVVGDVVRIGDVLGRVEHLTLRRTRILQKDTERIRGARDTAGQIHKNGACWYRERSPLPGQRITWKTPILALIFIFIGLRFNRRLTQNPASESCLQARAKESHS